jgi:hypothetical protein
MVGGELPTLHGQGFSFFLLSFLFFFWLSDVRPECEVFLLIFSLTFRLGCLAFELHGPVTRHSLMWMVSPVHI